MKGTRSKTKPALGVLSIPIERQADLQKSLFSVFTPLGLIFLLAYAALQFRLGYSGLAILYILASIALVVNLILVRRHKNYPLAANIFAGIGPIVLLPWQVTGTFDHASYLWFGAYIMFVLLFTGLRSGSFWLAVTYAASLIISAVKPDIINFDFLWQFYFWSVIMYLLIFVFVRVIEHLYSSLDHQKQLLLEAQKLTHLGNWEWDITQDIVHWSPQMYTLFGMQPSSHKVSYQTYLTYIHPDDREAVDRRVREAFASHKPFSITHRIIRPDKKLRWIKGEGTVNTNEEHAPVRMVGTAQDITDIKLVESQLERRNRELEETNKLMIGRELKMIALKKELKQALTKDEGERT